MGGCSDLCQLYSDGRRENATALMKALPHEQRTPEGLVSVLSTPPVLASDTRFTGPQTQPHPCLLSLAESIRPELSCLSSFSSLTKVRSGAGTMSASTNHYSTLVRGEQGVAAEEGKAEAWERKRRQNRRLFSDISGIAL